MILKNKREFFGFTLAVFVMIFSFSFVSANIVINEFASDVVNQSDWVEIYNSGADFDLSNCTLFDAVSDIESFENQTILSNNYLVADVGSRLNKGGDSIILICNNQTIDSVIYGAGNSSAPIPPQNSSVGRFPNGADSDNDLADFKIFETNTKGASNGGDQEEEPPSPPDHTPISRGSKAGTGVGIDIETEDFAPLIWFCGDRFVYDDHTEPGRINSFQCQQYCENNYPNDDAFCKEVLCKEELFERVNNYAFEGEKIEWNVLVMDKNGIEKVRDVYATVGDRQGDGNPIEANCYRDNDAKNFIESGCNARIGEEDLTHELIDHNTQAYYKCELTVETPESMYGEYWITIEVEDLDGLTNTIDENEYWFLNPVVALGIDGTLSFEDVRPGTQSYSDTILITNDADDGSGVILDMFISGTDFYDSSSSGAKCPISNVLKLSNFKYFASNGGYSTRNDARADDEGYIPIKYGIGFNDPNPFYDNNEILQAAYVAPYYAANVLTPGSDLALTFKLALPEPCNGDFDSGSIYFWGEAI